MRLLVATLLVFATALAAAGAPAPAQAQDPFPLATCFWEGPISTERPTTRGFDGRNFNFPEESATYWLARFTLPEGTKLRLRGDFPHGRYMSVNAYSDGVPTDSLSDIAIAGDPGATNPYIVGARRDAKQRGWTLQVLDEALPAGDRAPNTIYAKPAEGQPIELAYRVYEPDAGLDLTGGTGLPVAELVRADGSIVPAEETCTTINSADRSITIQTVPAQTWQAATSCREGHPAFDPVRFERFFNIDYSTLSVPADCTEAGFAARRQYAPESKGGFYSNKDTSYVFAHLSQVFGETVVLTGRLPSYPATREGQRIMAGAQLRFWSLCTGESRVTVRTPDCLADRQLVLDPDRTFSIVVSTKANRPSNARPECGLNWLDWGDGGDGAGRPDYGLVILRNMLVSPDFAQAVQKVPRPGAEAETMGPYFPQAVYQSRAQVESRGCRPPAKKQSSGPKLASPLLLDGVPSARRCRRYKEVRLRLIGADGQRLRSAKVTANGRRVRTRRSGDRRTARIRFSKRLTLRVDAVLGDGRRVRVTRRYRAC